MKVAVVTGSNQGIGLETLKIISPAVDVAILATRSAEKGTEAAEKLKEAGFKNIVFKPLDLASSESIASFVSRMKGEGPPLQYTRNFLNSLTQYSDGLITQ